MTLRVTRTGWHARRRGAPPIPLRRCWSCIRGCPANDVWLHPAAHRSSHTYADYANINAVVGTYHFNSFRPTSELIRDLQRIGELLQKGQLPL